MAGIDSHSSQLHHGSDESNDASAQHLPVSDVSQHHDRISEAEQQVESYRVTHGSPDNQPSYTLLQALHAKYGSSDEPLDFAICVSWGAPGKTESAVLIIPNILGLNYVNISQMGEPQELRTLCKQVTDLDLSHNNISDWQQVFVLLKTLAKLRFLTLSYNPLQLSPALSNDLSSCIPAAVPLTNLVLNGTGTNWDSVWKLLPSLPCLEELHLCKNDLSHVDRPQNGATFPRIVQLHLSANKFHNIEDILAIGEIFPQLYNLVMIDNPIKILSLSPETCQATFPCLCKMNLSQCSIESWSDLVTFQHYPQLTELRILEIPLVQKYEKQLFWQLTISYLPNIIWLNGTKVSGEERAVAERTFIRHYMNLDDKPPRYDELMAVHGNLQPLVEVDFSVRKTLSVTVIYDGKTMLKTIGKRWTLVLLKQFLEKTIVHHPIKDIEVYHEDVCGHAGHDLMRYDTRIMTRYGIKDGDALHVFLKGCDLSQPIETTTKTTKR